MVQARASNGGKLNVEYVSANPTGPMHVGHCRGAVFGDALANLLTFAGYDVTREYYINDAGGQVNVLARSVFLRYREALGEEIGEFRTGFYPGDYLKPVGEALATEHGRALLDMPEEKWLPIVRTFAIDAMMEMIKDDLAALNIRHDVFFSEASLTRAAGIRSRPPSRYSEKRGSSTRVSSRSPKATTTRSGKIARRRCSNRRRSVTMKIARCRSRTAATRILPATSPITTTSCSAASVHLINVFGADHIGYIPRMKAAVAALSDGAADLDIKVVNSCGSSRTVEPYKMSKRAGTFVTLRDVVDEVGRDPVRFMMLYRKNQETLDFDFAKVTEQSKDNPVFYVQYAHARSASVFRNAVDQIAGLDVSPATLANADLTKLTDAGEIELIKTPRGAFHVSSKEPLPRTSHTGWRSISMIWQAASMASGREAMIRHI